jgi:ribosome biogenesis GTPase
MIDSPELAPLRRIGLSAALWGRMSQLLDAGLEVASAEPLLRRVTEAHRDGVVALHDGHAARRARTHPRLQALLDVEGGPLAVGDWVLAADDAHGDCWVHARIAPLTQIARRLHDGRDKVTRVVLVANVDTVLLVMGLDHDFNLRRLERYVALARMAGLPAVLVLTKADECAQAERRAAEAATVLPAEVPVLTVDGRDPAVAQALAPWLQPGQTLVVVGSSGAGKSTLTRTLVAEGPDDEAGRLSQLRTGAHRADDSRGRHTTTSRSLWRTPGGACLIDTPGLRTLRLDADPEDVAGAFDDVARWANHCRFRDCRHENEPGCAVREHVPAARLRNFQKLQRESARDRMSALERKAQLQSWKVRSKAGRQRAQEKR